MFAGRNRTCDVQSKAACPNGLSNRPTATYTKRTITRDSYYCVVIWLLRTLRPMWLKVIVKYTKDAQYVTHLCYASLLIYADTSRR